MLHQIRFIFLIFFVSLIVAFPAHPIAAQSISAEQVESRCRAYLEEEKQMLADSNYVSERLAEITTQPMQAWLEARTTYYARLGYRFNPNPHRKLQVIQSDTAYQCRLADEGVPEVYLEVDSIEGGWKIIGIEGGVIGEKEAAKMDSLSKQAIHIARQKESIYETLRRFFDALNAYKMMGESDSLERLCTPDYFSIIEIGREMDSVEGVEPREKQLKGLFSEWVSGDTAICRSQFNYKDIGTHYLIREQGAWLVCGEQEFIASKAWIAAKQRELEALKEKVDLRNFSQSTLTPALNEFLRAGEAEALRTHTTPEFFSFLEQFRLKYGRYRPSYIKSDGPVYPVNPATHVRIKEDSAMLRSVEQRLYFLRENGNWLLAGFNEKFGEELDAGYLSEHFAALQAGLGVAYSAYNGPLEEVYLPQNGEADTATYHFATTFMLFPGNFPTGRESLPEFMARHLTYTKKIPIGTSPYVFISFVVQKDGSLTDIELIQSPKEWMGKAAIKMVEAMPRWQPATIDDQPVKMYQVLIVPFR